MSPIIDRVRFLFSKRNGAGRRPSGRLPTGLAAGCVLFCCVAVSAVAEEPSATRSVTYYGNVTLSLPEKVERVASAWEAQNSILAMLGYGDRIVATTRGVRDMPVFGKFVPSIKDAPLASMGGPSDINVEQLIALHPDVLFVPRALPPAKQEQLDRAGIAVAALHDNSLDALVERVVITGEILGPDALAKALRYKAYFEANKKRVGEALAAIPPERRLRVFLASGASLMTSGRPSLNQDWMDLGGAVNIAENWGNGGGYGTSNPGVSIESVVAANPDVVIAMKASDAEAIRHDPQWRNVKAVREGRVYANPRGMFWWCRETSEEALQFLWLAKTLYPEALPDVDMRKETKAFYQDFYGYELTDAEVDDFLVPSR